MTDAKLQTVIEQALDRAENIWREVEPEFRMLNADTTGMFSKADSIPTNIPDHPTIDPLKPEVDDFIAFVLDIRDSTKHLLEAIKNTKASQLKRILYETTAINTAGCLITEEYDGKITEFLGDGFLALYKVGENPEKVYPAHHAAAKCIRVVKEIVNPLLQKRYGLPPLQVGIGMAYGKAIITAVGNGANLHPKALGECVFRASKISDGVNEIKIDEKLKLFWPTSKNGLLRFIPQNDSKHGFKQYRITKQS